ncbi:RNA 2',3'-cyclic phosphodiesterase [Streptomyces sp. NPDC008150]|uniref:RNA 2',3'-cyclic phosphodiesterase n=1 Tax=Streptomyces sp. NPDC008150 TaxID=3364816 RepID=UPI0036E1E63E
MRLFAALLPPPGASRPLAAAVDGLRALPGAEELRWTDRGGWHITLAFYGEVDDDAVPRLTGQLTEAAARTEPFAVALHSGGTFGRDRVLWARVRGDREALRKLSGRCVDAGLRAGATREPDGLLPFTPHLTLARGTGTVGLHPYLSALHGYDVVPWVATRVALVRSDLPLPGRGTPGGRPRYTTVARMPLGGAR